MKNNNNNIIKPSWLSGFIDGDGCFEVGILPNSSILLNYQVQLGLILTQHKRDIELLRQIVAFFGGGQVVPQSNPNVLNYRLRDFKVINSVLVPLLDEYPLLTTKRHDYADFKLIHDIMVRKEHLTDNGLQQIRALKAGINRGRKNNK